MSKQVNVNIVCDVFVPKSTSRYWMYKFLKNSFPRTHSVKIFMLHVGSDHIKAYFRDWDVAKDGLIYNNPKWMFDFRKNISKLLGVNVLSNDINYSEQGQQGKDFVHMDASPKILRAFGLTISNPVKTSETSYHVNDIRHMLRQLEQYIDGVCYTRKAHEKLANVVNEYKEPRILASQLQKDVVPILNKIIRCIQSNGVGPYMILRDLRRRIKIGS